MAILTREAILREIEAGNIGVEPFIPSNIGPASIDLHLGNEIRRFVSDRHIIPVQEEFNYENITELVHINDGDHYLLLPGETILGITREKITLAGNICGWLEGRSRFARLGLLVHISASFMQPGISNKQVLEMSNFGPMALAIMPGTKICQFIFQKTIGEAHYHGKFSQQDEGHF
jgi:dCTP deaminase